MELVCGASAANNPPHPAPTDTTAVGHEISHVPTRSQIYPVYDGGALLPSGRFSRDRHCPPCARPSSNSSLDHPREMGLQLRNKTPKRRVAGGKKSRFLF
jgi:hypothetical protein